MFFQNSFEQNSEVSQGQEISWLDLQTPNAEFFGKWVIVLLFVVVGFIVWPRSKKNKFNSK